MIKVLALACAVALGASCAHAAPGWTAAYTLPAFSPADAVRYHENHDYAGRTVREVIRLNASGQRLRIKFTNETGDEAVTLGDAHIALAGPRGDPVPGSDHQLSFGGATGVTAPAGAPIYADPVDLPTQAFGDLVVSLYFPAAGPVHLGGHLAKVEVVPGDATAAPILKGAEHETGPSFVSRIDVTAAHPTKVLVTVGDSITEGGGATVGAHMSWPEQFARRLAASRYGRDWSLVNAGISGNRILHDNAGPNLLARFDRDVLDVPGVAAVILLEGINDIGNSRPDAPGDQVTADALIASLKQVIARAHAHGVRIYGATITPFEGAFYYTVQGEATRQAVNAWIRTGGAYDGVIDFEAVARDPLHPTRLSPALDSRDHLHPGDAGYAIMAGAVPFDILAEPLAKR